MNTAPNGNHMKQALLILVVIAAVARITWWVTTVEVIENEGAEYAHLADNIYSKGTYDSYLGIVNLAAPPLYPALIGLVNIVTGDLELSGRLISLLAGIGLVVLVFLLAGELFGQRAAWLAGLFAALHPVLVGISVSVLTESLAWFLMVLGAWLGAVAMRQASWQRAALAGAVLGLGYWTRPELLPLAGLVGGACGLWHLVHTRRWLPAIGMGLAPVLAGLLVAAPYMAYLSHEAGHFVWEGKSAVNRITNARMQTGMDYAEASHGLGASIDPEPLYEEGPYLVGDHRAFIREPGPKLGDVIDKLIDTAPERARSAFWTLRDATYIGAPAIVLLAVVGFFAAGWWRNHWGAGLLLASFIGLQGATLLAVEHHFARYFFPLVPLLIPWAAAGINSLFGMLLRWLPATKRALATAVAGLLAVTAVTVSAYPAARLTHELAETRDDSAIQAGRWIWQDWGNGSDREERPLLMTYSAAITFYADAATNAIPPYATPERALEYIKRKSPDYIALQSSNHFWSPYAVTWVEEGIPHDCAVPVFEARSSIDVVVRVWRWECAD